MTRGNDNTGGVSDAGKRLLTYAMLGATLAHYCTCGHDIDGHLSDGLCRLCPCTRPESAEEQPR